MSIKEVQELRRVRWFIPSAALTCLFRVTEASVPSRTFLLLRIGSKKGTADSTRGHLAGALWHLVPTQQPAEDDMFHGSGSRLRRTNTGCSCFSSRCMHDICTERLRQLLEDSEK